jgi:hypothetical protein
VGDMMSRVRDLGRLFWRNAKETGESAAEMIEQRTQIQRLAGQVRRLDKERNGLVRQIGAKVYGLHGQGKVRNQDVLVDCQRIDAIIEEIAKARHEIEVVRAASLEKGIEIPVLEDEAPLTEEAEGVDATAVAEAAPEASEELAAEAENPAAAKDEESSSEDQ